MDAEAPPLPARVEPAEGTAWQEVDGLVVLIDLTGGEYHSFDEVGTRMWRLLESEPRVEDALVRLLEEYDVEEPRLRRDLATFIETLVGIGALRREPAA